MGWDSNPRDGDTAYTRSRRAPSTTRPPILRKPRNITMARPGARPDARPFSRNPPNWRLSTAAKLRAIPLRWSNHSNFIGFDLKSAASLSLKRQIEFRFNDEIDFIADDRNISAQAKVRSLKLASRGKSEFVCFEEIILRRFIQRYVKT